MGGGLAGWGAEFGQHGGDVVSTVLTEMNSLAAISALVCLAQISSSTSCSRRVSRPGGPGGCPRPGGDRADAERAHLVPGELDGGGSV